MEASGVPPPLARVVAELSEPLLRYLERYVGDRAVAEDLLQETLIRIDRVFYRDDDNVLRCDRKPLTVLGPTRTVDDGVPTVAKLPR